MQLGDSMGRVKRPLSSNLISAGQPPFGLETLDALTTGLSGTPPLLDQKIPKQRNGSRYFKRPPSEPLAEERSKKNLKSSTSGAAPFRVLNPTVFETPKTQVGYADVYHIKNPTIGPPAGSNDANVTVNIGKTSKDKAQKPKTASPPQPQPPARKAFQIHDGIAYVAPIRFEADQLVPDDIYPMKQIGNLQLPSESGDQFPGTLRHPLAGCLGFIKSMARGVGRFAPGSMGIKVYGMAGTEGRRHKEHLGRYRSAIDGSALVLAKKTAPAATRKSSRARNPTEVFSFKEAEPARPTSRMRSTSTSPPPEDKTDVRQGVEYQAIVPDIPLKKKKKTMGRSAALPEDEDEARWVSEEVMQADEFSTDELMHTHKDYSSLSREERLRLIENATGMLIEAVGRNKAEHLGLLSMGPCSSQRLRVEEEVHYLEGMKEHGRDFYKIKLNHLPQRTVRDMAAHYYDIWKQRCSSSAKDWYVLQAEKEAAAQAEIDRLEKEREAEMARRVQKQIIGIRKRQLQEAAMWVRLAARSPGEVVWNKHAVRERAGRMASVLRCGSSTNTVENPAGSETAAAAPIIRYDLITS